MNFQVNDKNWLSFLCYLMSPELHMVGYLVTCSLNQEFLFSTHQKLGKFQLTKLLPKS